MLQNPYCMFYIALDLLQISGNAQPAVLQSAKSPGWPLDSKCLLLLHNKEEHLSSRMFRMHKTGVLHIVHIVQKISNAHTKQLYTQDTALYN